MIANRRGAWHKRWKDEDRRQVWVTYADRMEVAFVIPIDPETGAEEAIVLSILPLNPYGIVTQEEWEAEQQDEGESEDEE